MSQAPPDLKPMIYHIVASIPAGKVTSYGQVAELAGYSGYARYVGSTLKHLPADTQLPWHRVLKSDGTIAFTKGSEAYTQQVKRLKQENVMVNNGKVSMKAHGWQQ